MVERYLIQASVAGREERSLEEKKRYNLTLRQQFFSMTPI